MHSYSNISDCTSYLELDVGNRLEPHLAKHQTSTLVLTQYGTSSNYTTPEKRLRRCPDRLGCRGATYVAVRPSVRSSEMRPTKSRRRPAPEIGLTDHRGSRSFFKTTETQGKIADISSFIRGTAVSSECSRQSQHHNARKPGAPQIQSYTDTLTDSVAVVSAIPSHGSWWASEGDRIRSTVYDWVVLM